MNKSRYIGWLGCALVLMLASYAGAAPGNLILNVPDWNQPDNYAAGTAGLNVGDYPGWCCPTSGANLMGYWEDQMGCTGLTDQQAFATSPAFPATGGTWQQGLWHDATVEMGWHMNTGSWQNQGPPPNFPPSAGSTALANIGPGMLNYAQGSWTDNDYAGGGGAGTGIVKTAYPNTSIGIDTVRNATMWANYKAEIDAGRPTVSSFAHWVLTPFIGTDTVDGFPTQTVEKYDWDTSVQEHCVTGVGYFDYTPGYNGDEWFIVHDNWPTTGTFVAVPLDTNWMQNDYVTNVPEPATMSLLAIGAIGLVVRKKRL